MKILATTAALFTAPLSAQAPFLRIELSPDHLSAGANVGDFDQDGIVDVTSGPFWWRGPHFAVRHTIYPAVPYPIGTYSPHFFSFVHDVDGDGWDDVVAVGFPGFAAHWYENPGAAGGPWPQHLLFASVATEAPCFEQLVPGGAPELVCGSGSQLGYLTPDPANPTNPWQFHAIANWPAPLTFLHGLGVGDVNGDGRPDVLTGLAWLEQPASLVGDPPWTVHPYPFAPLAGAGIHVYDVDGDGDSDLISSRDAHGYGLSWFENVAAGGSITFVEHVILPATAAAGPVQFSQLHGLAVEDVDGDGLKDIVTGKTFWAHLGSDPGALDPAVVYWFELQRSAGMVTYVPHRIHDSAGIGRQVIVADVSGDGRPDVIVGNRKGVCVYQRSSFWSDVENVSIQAGGSQNLWLDAGVAHAAAPYVVVGTMSGTSPGTQLGSVHLPINVDGYTWVVLGMPPTFFWQFQGLLSGSGTASARFDLPAGLPLVGPLELHHAFVAVDAQGGIAVASNAVRLLLQ